MNKLFKNAMVWIVIAVVLLTVFQSFTPNSIRQQTLDYTSFIELVKTGNVSEVVFEDNMIKAKRINGDRFITYNPETDNTALISELSESGVRIGASPLENYESTLHFCSLLVAEKEQERVKSICHAQGIY